MKSTSFSVLNNNTTMMQHLRPTPFYCAAFLCFLVILGLSGCEKLNIEPDNYEYPLALTVQNHQSVAELTWTEATVSTFEEYLILRSTESLSDNPEPEVTGNTQIIARIDERGMTTFRDSNLPISDTVYYKVYARIADRFLLSPTIKYIQNLHLVPLRSDIIEPVPAKGVYIGFDRTNHQLFIYDFINREIVLSKSFQQLSFPLISYGDFNNEILLSENSVTQLLDYNTLNPKSSFQSGPIRKAQYQNGWIYLTRAQFPFDFALYRRSDLSLKGEMELIQADWRGFSVKADPSDINNATIYDFSLGGCARYIQNNTNLSLDLQRTEFISGGFVLVASHPQRTEFVVSNTGVIMNEDLEVIHTLDNGALGFSFLTYSPDGSRLFGLSFLDNEQVIRIYDTENNYAFLEEYAMSNQISPMALFADDEHVYMVSLVFLTTSTQTLINVIEY